MSVLIEVNEDLASPIFRQIIDQIVDMVDTGKIRPGVRLPSTRSMADRLAVSRSTVCRAYEELWSLGYLESRPGSYTTIRNRKRVASKQDSRRCSLIDWSARTAPGSNAAYSSQLEERVSSAGDGRGDAVDFASFSPDIRFSPTEVFRKSMNDALAYEGPSLLQYGDVLGYRPLREFIAQRMGEHSVSVTADEIIITVGAENAIDLLVRMLAAPGRTVIVESPTYSKAISMLRMSGAKITGIPMKASGMDLDVLEAVLSKESPAFVYTIPNFHNPTGITTDQGHREKLLAICERYRVPLLEDGYEEEMKYFGKTVLPIKSMDHSNVVVYIGTFSKILFPGLRVGWIAADPQCIDRLSAIQKATIISGSVLDQAALYRFCRPGHYDLHVKRMRVAYRRRMQRALKMMHECLNRDYVEWTQPVGGYTIWLKMKVDIDDDRMLFQTFIDHGIVVLPGRACFSGTPSGTFFRISVAHPDEQEIEKGLRRLGAAMDHFFTPRSVGNLPLPRGRGSTDPADEHRQRRAES